MLAFKMSIGELEVKRPIVQGGMGVGVSLSGLAAAVANAGGVGVIAAAGIGMNEPDYYKSFVKACNRALQNEIRAARGNTTGIVGVNIMSALSNFAELVGAAIKEKVDVIFSGAGLPLDLPKHLNSGSRTKLVPIVSSARAAVLICRKWKSRFGRAPDALVLEGPMAGGHLGFTAGQIDDPNYSLDKLLPELLAAIAPYRAPDGKKIPVIAAGGVYTGADIYKYMKMGAAGVQMGTRFVATHECDADDAFKKAYVNATEEDVIIIKSPVGLPGRAIRNSFLDSVGKGDVTPSSCPYHCMASCDYEKAPYCISLALMNAKKGNLKNGFAFAGKNVSRVNSIVSVNQLMQSLEDEFYESERLSEA